MVMGSRNGDQCWKRWYNSLDPRIDKSPWITDEVSESAHKIKTARYSYLKCTGILTVSSRMQDCSTKWLCTGGTGRRL